MVENARAERKLAAILAADVVGYSRLMGLDDRRCRAAWPGMRIDRNGAAPRLASQGARSEGRNNPDGSGAPADPGRVYSGARGAC
jgi:hypothetical protein